MGIYQALQLNALGSKQLIKNSKNKKEKIKWTLVYILKLFLTILFCSLFVTTYSIIFGNDNSIVGVVVLLILLTVRQADFGIRKLHSAAAIILTFLIYAIGPRFANTVSPLAGMFVNTICILSIMVLSCHNVIMSNHFIFVLSYLLLLGYDATGKIYETRLFALASGAIICTAIFLFKHRKRSFKRNFSHLIKEFNIFTTRTQWQLKITIGISTSMLLASYLEMPRVMWVGIASMSLLTPFREDMYRRAKQRAPFNTIGCIVFFILYSILPNELIPFVGIIGGFGVGISATYPWQNVFNSLGALSVASGIYGLWVSIFLRIAANFFSTAYSLVFVKIYDFVIKNIMKPRENF